MADVKLRTIYAHPVHGTKHPGEILKGLTDQEANDLVAELQARALALRRSQTAGAAVLQVAINEALVGLTDQARARSEAAEEAGIVSDETIWSLHGARLTLEDNPAAGDTPGLRVSLTLPPEAAVPCEEAAEPAPRGP